MKELIGVRLTPAEYDRAVQLAAKQGVTIPELLRRALAEQCECCEQLEAMVGLHDREPEVPDGPIR